MFFAILVTHLVLVLSFGRNANNLRIERNKNESDKWARNKHKINRPKHGFILLTWKLEVVVAGWVPALSWIKILWFL